MTSGSAVALLILTFGAYGVRAQTQYRNLDAGRPTRVEDAQTAGRYALDIDLASLQVERLAGSTMKYRGELKLGYGVAPLTELEVRLPIVRVAPPRGAGTAVAGIAGFAIGATRTLTLETIHVPAIALTSELSLPVGQLASSRASFLAKALVTKTIPFGRLHLNAGVGTYAVRTAPAQSSSSSDCDRFSGFRLRALGDTTCGGTGPPIIVDLPCNVVPRDGAFAASAALMCMATRAETTTVATLAPTGHRSFVGLAFDHSFPLASTLLVADVFTERFAPLYDRRDWTAELGLRHQVTPVVVLDAGIGWHFAGAVRSATVTFGATYELATPPLFGR